MTPLACPSCGASFRASDLDRSLGIATCHACGEVLDLRTRSPADEARLDALTRPAPSGAVPLPQKFQVTDSGGQLEVRWRWFNAGHVFSLGFAVLWNAFMVAWMGGAILGKAWPMVAFGSLHALVGVGLAYWSLAGLLNSTRVRLSQGELRVTHGPVPWPGGLWRREDLAQLYGEESASRRNNRTHLTWTLCAMTRDGRRHSLVKGLTEKAQVLWLERTLEARMNIVDQPVHGEMAK